MTLGLLTCLSEERPAKTIARDTPQDQEGLVTAWMETVLASPSIMSDLWSDGNQHGQDGLFGKMSLTSWRHGIPVDFSALPQTLPRSGILLPGECLTSDTLGHPISQDKDCSWSDIVTQDAPQQYYLSRKALNGIARRKRQPRLFSRRGGEWLLMTERRAFWTKAAQG